MKQCIHQKTHDDNGDDSLARSYYVCTYVLVHAFPNLCLCVIAFVCVHVSICIRAPVVVYSFVEKRIAKFLTCLWAENCMEAYWRADILNYDPI